MVTSAPARAKRRAVARPIPDAPPVIRATFVRNDPVISQAIMLALLEMRLGLRQPETGNFFLSARKPTCSFRSVNRIHVPSDIGRVVGSEKSKQSRNFFRLGMAAQRNFPVHFLQHLIGV